VKTEKCPQRKIEVPGLSRRRSRVHASSSPPLLMRVWPIWASPRFHLVAYSARPVAPSSTKSTASLLPSGAGCPVNINGYLDAVIPWLVAYIRKRHACLYEQACIGVPRHGECIFLSFAFPRALLNTRSRQLQESRLVPNSEINTHSGTSLPPFFSISTFLCRRRSRSTSVS